MQINYKYVFYFFVICCIVAGIIIVEEEKKGNVNVKASDGKVLLGIFVPILIIITIYEVMEMKKRKNIAYRGNSYNVRILDDGTVLDS